MSASSKLQLAVLCGGQSAEHEVSLASVQNVLQAVDPEKYITRVIFIAKTGQWYLYDSPPLFLELLQTAASLPTAQCQQVALVPGAGEALFSSLTTPSRRFQADVIFPVLHGTYGEDGTVQGLAKLVNTPIVGTGILGSAICMDKEITKKLLRAANIPVANWLSLAGEKARQASFDTIVEQVGLPFFVKPANTGSSVGISKVKQQAQFQAAVELALQYDHKILFEQNIVGREIECSVLGNENPVASLPGGIKVHHEFYTYEAKYLDPNGATLQIPAELPPAWVTRIQAMAVAAFQACCCESMARVDFFVTDEGQVVVNELNTLPGFTQISMYPKMWCASGLTERELLDRLIQLAWERAARERDLAHQRLPKTVNA